MLIQMDMNTAETLIGCGEKLGLIMVQVAKVLMEIEIGDFIGEVSNYRISSFSFLFESGNPKVTIHKAKGHST